MAERVETKKPEMVYSLLEGEVSREPTGEKSKRVNWEEELSLARTALENALSLRDPQTIGRLIERLPEYRTLKWEGQEWRSKPFLEQRPAREVLHLATEFMVAAERLNSPIEAEDLLQRGRLYALIKKDYLLTTVIEVANQYSEDKKRMIVPNVSFSDRAQKLLDLFAGIHILKEQNSDVNNIKPVPYGALFATPKPVQGEFALEILRSYQRYVQSLPNKVPEGRQILENVMIGNAWSVINGFERWRGEHLKEAKRLSSQFAEVSDELDSLFKITVDNPQWLQSLIRVY